MDSVWMVEYRNRARKNGRWSEWQPVDNINGGRPASAYSEYPSHLVFAHDHHERRAVEFVAPRPPAKVERGDR